MITEVMLIAINPLVFIGQRQAVRKLGNSASYCRIAVAKRGKILSARKRQDRSRGETNRD